MWYSKSLTIDKHIHTSQVQVATYHGSLTKRSSVPFEEYDIILTTYETLRFEWNSKGALFQRKWSRLVLDEGP